MRDFLYPLRVLHGRLHDYSQERKCLKGVKCRIRAADRNTVLFVLTPTHGNLGDHAIAAAVSQMLKELGVYYMEITERELKLMQKHHKMKLMNTRPILVNGGGNIGTLWLSVEKLFRSIIQDCPDSPIMCLPNSAFFEDSDAGQREYALSKKIYQSHPRLTICARERISYTFLKRMHDRVALIPDMVLSLNKCKPGTERKGCLLCLRSDREQTRSEETNRAILEQTAKLFQGNVFDSDMFIGKPVSAETREKELELKFALFRSAELVVTDRLHGMIFAAITGTPCIVIDSMSPKVRGCYEWIQDLGYIRFADSPAEIPELYRTMPENRQYSNEHLQKYYETLKKELQVFR